MTRGFTLLELLITVSVLSILIATAAPSFSSVLASTKIKRLAPEVHGFLIAARSEAITRNQDLYLFFLVSGSSGAINNSDGDWDMVLSSSASFAPGNVLMQLDGSSYRDINIAFNFSGHNSISVDGTRGRFGNGNITMAPVNALSEQLSVIASITTGRIRICSSDPNQNGRNNIGHHGYEIC
ncbi:GspH/FimT family pseudopilin [Vibrio lentus]|uniref:Type II secretion system protein H n=1 Tax=Vibrio lentus TaxID=136468 RepID=A0AA45AA60_9VIBR|nr:GspH/FimT family pseudopilin [Vibrio lentus]MCB5357560.1 prepilin-type N-terminal cleavage/methylation domain-containing protein [Vibrio lentus]MCB5448028.1 prepilin-type N-terminal cleavage/methylation domain-containing protein [Vibrio lentus]MCB5459890.1 prepilin-type N-terminal cleavage/methylation domain-containing protein [Vibrio lentus]MCC4794964.1 GspH/FimT family pseudopilin [Vibrio lentus]MCC4851443.1 GspH/FimT family pseudopilin [Vibrio lentus]